MASTHPRLYVRSFTWPNLQLLLRCNPIPLVNDSQKVVVEINCFDRTRYHQLATVHSTGLLVVFGNIIVIEKVPFECAFSECLFR